MGELGEEDREQHGKYSSEHLLLLLKLLNTRLKGKVPGSIQ